MKIISSHESPNYDASPISVEFVVIHFTALEVEGTLARFLDPSSKVSSHLLIDRDGSTYELVKCLSGKAQRAWHAGESFYELGGKSWKMFNDFSLGIELVNLNGNVFDYSEAQYESLSKLFALLSTHYPNLRDPTRIVGHEHIAGFRGKLDPGRCFDWARLYRQSFPTAPAAERTSLCSDGLALHLRALAQFAPVKVDLKEKYWQNISALCECAFGRR